MPFTGRLGTPNSRFADLVFGAPDGFGPGAPDFLVHQLTSNTVRVLFNVRVKESALALSSYLLSPLGAPGTSFVPSILSSSFYDEIHDSVVLMLSSPLTTGSPYSVTVSEVEDTSGDFIMSAARNFTANVIDPPRALGSFLSKRGYVDILFDRPVGPYSSLATFSIADAIGGPSVAMSQSTWAGEGIPETTLRLSLPIGTPTADAFAITTSGVTDVSLNQSSESVPLTLSLRSPPPFSLADLTQLQLLGAYVTDVSSDFLRTANVRAFFSCPVAGASSVSAWSALASGAHPRTDDQDALTAPAATDLPSLIALLNDLRSSLNSHLSIDQVHLSSASADIITVSAATDLPSAVSLVNAIVSALPSHMVRGRVHLYPETVNRIVLPSVLPSDLPGAIFAANKMAVSYSGHILSEYPLSFSSAYQAPLGPATAYAMENAPDSCFDVEGPLTYFVDLRFVLDVEAPSVRLEATLTSEDGGSSCTPSDYTGSIIAVPASSPARILSSLVAVDTWVDLRLDRPSSSPAEAPLFIVGQDGVPIPTTASVRSTLATALWCYNNALEAYRRHIVPGAAGHQVNDNVNMVNSGDYAFLPLGAAISSANEVRLKVMAHMASAVFHYHADPQAVSAPPATDLTSFIALAQDLASILSSHLVKVGPHVFAGYRMVSAPPSDSLRLSVPGMLDLSSCSVEGYVLDSHVYNGLPVPVAPSKVSSRSHLEFVSHPFAALGVPPSVSSALPQSGLPYDSQRGASLNTDRVQVFFSKPMRQVPLAPSDLLLSGGSLQSLSAIWVSPLLAEIAVTKMEAISYSVTAPGLSDEAGNPVA